MAVNADAIIYAEMMAHPILFTHPHPKTVLIVGDENQTIKQEVAKHLDLEITEALPNSLTKILDKTFDVIIVDKTSGHSNLELFLKALALGGLLIQESQSLFASDAIMKLQQSMHGIGFSDSQLLNFPQPDNSLSWCGAVLAAKEGNCGRIREKDIFNKTFSTYYYNYDTHKAALCLPEFIRKELMTE